MRPTVISLSAACAAALVALAGTPCAAADLGAAPVVKAPPIEAASDWKFQATFYLWATALNGDVGIGDLPTSHVDVSAWDAIEHLDGALMGSFLARNGDWMILTDLVWNQVSADGSFGNNGGRIDYTQTQVTASALVGFRLPLGLPDNVDLSATVGLRYQYLKGDVDISPGLTPDTISRDASRDWVDPTVGLSLQYQINDKWFVNALGDVGGFGVGSQFTAQGFASVGYMWTPTVSTALGYRAIYVDYDNDGFIYNTTQHGVFTSVAFHF